MSKNKILDYEQVKEKLNILIQNQNGVNKIEKKERIGITETGEEILHYTVGNGKNHIVISGAFHGCEIISTDFILQVMEKIKEGDKRFDFLSKGEFTLHFIPMVNPDGYIVSTSAIRELIPREMSSEDAEKICTQYYKSFYKDDENSSIDESEKSKLKLHQEMFKNVNYTCIPEKYKVREKIKELYEKYDIPAGTLQTWSSNSNGIDLNQNSQYNSKIEKIKNGEKIYNILRYNNILASTPGPIGCPCKEVNYSEENEVIAINNLLEKLQEQNGENLCGYFNYHSSGGLIFQRPSEDNIKENEGKINDIIVYNYLVSNFYSENTNYKLLTGESRLNCLNDVIRIKTPGDLLVELSKIGGNPLGPYADIEGNYKDTINKNISALAETIKIQTLVQTISKESSKFIEEQFQARQLDRITIEDKYYILNLIYAELKEKIKMLQKIDKDVER